MTPGERAVVASNYLLFYATVAATVLSMVVVAVTIWVSDRTLVELARILVGKAKRHTHTRNAHEYHGDE